MNFEFGIYNLWIILVVFGFFATLLMAIGDNLRGTKIENKEDHSNPTVAVVSFIPFLALLIVSIFTPITTGLLFYAGFLLLVIVATIYALSIKAFIKTKNGITMCGIYKFSRNPMYVALFLAFVSFSLMAWQVEPVNGLVILIIAILKTVIVHWMVLKEEQFLTEKYGDIFLKYMNKTPRYLGLSKK